MDKFWKGVIVGFLTACLLVVAVGAFAQGRQKVFPIGKKIMVQALVCFHQDAATVIARLKGQRHEFIDHLISQGWCVVVNGVGSYEKKVVDEGEWGVWTIKFGDSIMYEATDWRSANES